MCGIAGIYRRGDRPIEEPRLVAMRDDQTHRGPDAVGLHVGPHIGLASNRLAIIDPSPAANQPMSTEDGEVWVVFNGEVYNFQDLRKDLEAKGRRFQTRSDTEVILQGYQQWGLDVIPRLNGMFALALWDAPRQVLHLARDRVGKKPLVFCETDGEVVFASEIRALLRGLERRPSVDPQALDAYLAYLVVPGDRCIFAGVHKVPPASTVTCSKTGVSTSRYWRLSRVPRRRCSEPEALERLGDLLTDATRIRMISDVPIGAFLSGGVDSSTVVALMSRISAPVRTFSVGFRQNAFNELPYARAAAAACGAQHLELLVEPDAASVLPRLIWHHGEPFADPSAIPTYHLAAAARREVTVVLNGDGGDENFAGYPWYRSLRAAELYCEMIPGVLRRRVLAPLGRTLGKLPLAPTPIRLLSRLMRRYGGSNTRDDFWIWSGYRRADRYRLYTPRFRADLGASDPADYCREVYRRGNGLGDVERALDVGIEIYLPDDLLVKMDIATMANSLEARSPLLDHRVIEFAAALPVSLHLKRLETKHLLKTYARDLVPRSSIHRPKQGFEVPLTSWLRGPLRRPLDVLLSHPRCAARGYLDPAYVRRSIDRHLAGANEGPRLWALLCLELWFRMFIDGDLHRDDSLWDLV